MGAACGTKLAVTFRADVMGTTQAPVPVQAPDQLLSIQPEAGLALSSTLVPKVYDSLQSPWQLMPGPVTVP